MILLTMILVSRIIKMTMQITQRFDTRDYVRCYCQGNVCVLHDPDMSCQFAHLSYLSSSCDLVYPS